MLPFEPSAPPVMDSAPCQLARLKIAGDNKSQIFLSIIEDLTDEATSVA